MMDTSVEVEPAARSSFKSFLKKCIPFLKTFLYLVGFGDSGISISLRDLGRSS